MIVWDSSIFMLSVKLFNNIVQETGCTGVLWALPGGWGSYKDQAGAAQSLVTLQYLKQGPLSGVTCNAMDWTVIYPSLTKH